jgi:tetratricopeptide (TPR) repeat protein
VDDRIGHLPLLPFSLVFSQEDTFLSPLPVFQGFLPLFAHSLRIPWELASVAADAFLLGQALEVLGAYSLLGRDPRTKTFSIHRLVQAVLADGMDEPSRQQWAERAVLAVNTAFPKVEYASWPQCERLLPHAQACAELIKDGPMQFPEAGRLLTQAGWYLKERAQYVQATSLTRRGLEIRAKLLEPEHSNRAQSLNQLGRLYALQGKYAQAESLLRRGLEIRERILEPEHSDRAKSLTNLALLYEDQRKYSEAQPLYRRALAIREQQLGPTHPHTAVSLNNLASLDWAQGKDERAEPLLVRALAINEQRLGPEHPDTAQSQWCLATLALKLGRLTEARALYEQSLAVYEQPLGLDHPRTLALREQDEKLLHEMQPYTRIPSVHNDWCRNAAPFF